MTGTTGIIITILILLFSIVYFKAQDSRKEKTKDKYVDAIEQITHSAADSISGFAQSITENSEEKKIRKAKENLAIRNGNLYRFKYYSERDNNELTKLFTIDNNLKESLDVLGLSEERWNKIAHHMFYLGRIVFMSRDPFDKSKKIPECCRQNILETWVNDSGSLKYDAESLKEALSYFDIPEEEWIKYGETVIEMHNIYDDRDIREFGLVTV